MSAITTHVLDTMAGTPGAGIQVTLERRTHSTRWDAIGEGLTNADGRANDLMAPDEALAPGNYRLTFETGAYFAAQDLECFFPQVTISFVVNDDVRHYHVPLLLSPYSYSTYRGS
jgi:5-hydroxyisourate hydrolase